jgi:hypothetical protein
MAMRAWLLMVLSVSALPAQSEVRLAFTPMPRQVPISRLEAPLV